MSRFRSLTDEQLAARWDFDGWVDSHGQRWQGKAGDEHVSECCKRTFAPRAECVPSPDPMPWSNPDLAWPWDRTTYQSATSVWDPRPAFARPPVNRVLHALRVYVETSDLNAVEYAQDWIDREVWTQQVFENCTPDEIDHARRVLARLAVLA